jgi:GDP-4-dehydro-6-deoxy-D-mannose reductase
VERGRNGQVYNICSGRETSIKTLLNQLIELTGLEVSIELDNSLIRSVELKRVYGSYDKINNEIGWFPQIPLRQTLMDTFSGWLNKLK